MFRNYLTVAIRNFVHHKLYSFINIAGLTVGLACAIFIILFIRDELSFNRWIRGSHDVYRVETTFRYPGSPAQNDAYAPFPLGPAMQMGIPEVQAVAHIVPESATVKAGDRLFPEIIDFVDPNFFTVVKLPLVAGDAARVLADSESVVLSQRAGRKYFGSADPVGRILTVGGKYPLIVTGVVRDPPHNSDFQQEIYISNKSKADQFGDENQWFSPETYTYVRLLPNAKPETVIAKAQAIIRRNAPASAFIQTHLTGDQIIHTRLVRLADIHLTGDEAGNHQAGSSTTIYGFAAIALLILLIACFNFINLATARAMIRAREVSLRKVVGARPGQLTAQFLGESGLTGLLALVFALAVVEVLLPAYDSFLDRPIVFHYMSSWPLVLGLIAVAVLTGVLGGIYPALVLSGFRPAEILKPNSAGMSGSGLLRTSLVVLQFAISIGLGIAAFVVFAQIRYARQIDLGFDRHDMVVLEGADNLMPAARESLMRRLASSPDIAGVAQSSAAPFNGLWQGTDLSVPGGTQASLTRIMTVSPDFFRAYDMKLLAGRLLSHDRGADVSSDDSGNSDTIGAGTNILVNAVAARKLGLAPQEAVGKIVRVGHLHSPARIVGVVGNAKFYGARDDVDPTVYVDRPYSIYVVSVRAKPGHIPQALDFIDRTWAQFAPTAAIRRHFLDDSFDKMFTSAEQRGTIFDIFVCIAIFIACLGLFGLAAFTAERRTKEIGVRKVFGARTSDIVRLLLWQFSIPILVANVIAWPVAWYYLHNWLESYAFRIVLSPAYFVAAGLIALLIAWATVFAHAFRVARANPVQALRCE